MILFSMKDEAPARTGVEREGGCKQREKVWNMVRPGRKGVPAEGV